MRGASIQFLTRVGSFHSNVFSPNYFKKVKISAVALLKMVRPLSRALLIN
jgi:hypothetical protein